VGDAAYPVPGELEHAAFGEPFREEDAVEAFPDAVALPASVGGRDDGCADHGVEARGVPAAGADGDASDAVGHGVLLEGREPAG